MKTLKNISVIILFVGLTFLTFYVTKSYYVFNDMNYKEIVNKIDAFFKVESKYVIERTTDMFNEMFYYRFKEITNFLDPYYNIEDSDYITKQILLPLNNLMSSLSVSDCDDREQERSKALINEKILKDILNILDK